MFVEKIVVKHEVYVTVALLISYQNSFQNNCIYEQFTVCTTTVISSRSLRCLGKSLGQDYIRRHDSCD